MKIRPGRREVISTLMGLGGSILQISLLITFANSHLNFIDWQQQP